MTRLWRVAGLLALCAMRGTRADEPARPSAATLVDAMRAARRSEGFEIRMSVTVTVAPGGKAGEPTKIVMIGRSEDDDERLLLRPISPTRVRDRTVVSRRTGEHVSSTSYGPAFASAGGASDPTDRLFGSGLVAWDLMAPWWAWKDQLDAGPQFVGGHPCSQVRSRADPGTRTPVREVLSCVDARNGLAWKTSLFDDRHRLLRSIEVTRAIRTQAGTSAARSATITEADGIVTRIEVYSGDEHHPVLERTFDPPAIAGPARD